MRQFASVLVVALAASGCAVNPVSGKRDFVTMSEQQEIALGRQSHAQILKQYPRYADERLQRYVDELGQALAAQSHRAHLDFHFTVVDSPQINAFALPGGYVYVTRGIMAYMSSEAELAGVLGHEIGHVTARHGVRQQSAQAATGLLAAVASAATKGRYDQWLGVGSRALVSGYGREHELEADRLGAEYLARTGRDPERMIEVVGILKDQEVFDRDVAAAEGREPRAYHGLFASHPKNDTRLREVIRAARQHAAEASVDDGRERYLRMIDGLVFGDSLEQGVVRDRHFYHGPLNLKLAAPAGWEIRNSPSKLAFVREGQGAYVEMEARPVGEARSPEAFLARLLQRPQPGGGRALRHAGMRGYQLVQRVPKLPWGQPGEALFTVWFRGETAWLFVSAAREPAQFARLRGEFDAISHSLAELSPADRAKAAPRRIALHRARAGDSFAALARETTLESYAVEQLRLINGAYPDGRPRAGQLLKLVQ